MRYFVNSDPERLKNTYRTDLSFSLTAYQHPDSGQAGYTVQVSPGGFDIDETLTVTLTPNAKHTLAALDKTGIFEEGYSLAGYEVSDSAGPYPATESR